MVVILLVIFPPPPLQRQRSLQQTPTQPVLTLPPPILTATTPQYCSSCGGNGRSSGVTATRSISLSPRSLDSSIGSGVTVYCCLTPGQDTIDLREICQS